MPCPASGQISIADLVAEFGGSPPHAMSEYYRNAGLVPGNNTSVPTSGQFALTSCYSAVNEIQHTHSDGDTHADYSTIFGSNWASTVPKRVIVPSGVTVGGTSTHAMLLPSGMGGTIVFEITGNVHGHGGAANGGAGGNAINCVQTTGVTITLNSGGTIKAGGGGGGAGGAGAAGGTGGAGGVGGTNRYTYNGSFVGTWGGVTGGPNHLANSYCCGYNAWAGSGNAHLYSNRVCGSHLNGAPGAYACHYGYWDTTWCGWCLAFGYGTGGTAGAGGAGGSGGAGGAGGVGQGYSQSAASGASGSAGASGSSGSAGGSGSNGGNGGAGGAGGDAGTGGTGGTGGAFGATGSTGATGGSGTNGSDGSAGSNGNYTNGAAGATGGTAPSAGSGSAGGAAGFYITNRGSITFNNSGTVAGQ